MDNNTKTNNIILIGLACIGVLLHILFNGQYDFHRDELDFIMNARQLDWGYVSYPPITPFFARLGLEIFGESLRGLRVIPAIAQGIVMVLAGLMARDMGGKRSAQIMAAIAVFITPMSLMGGTLIMYFTFDYLWWVLTAFFVVRLTVTADARYWLGIGAAIGLGMMTKYTMIFWVTGLVVAVLVTDARKYLRSKWLYFGATLALLIFLPNMIWQIQHDFISLRYLTAIHARDIQWGRAEGFWLDQFYQSTNPFTLPLWAVGLVTCLFATSMKRFRILGWMFVVTFFLFLINRGRGYYIGPAYVMLLAAGAAWIENWLDTRPVTTRRLGAGLLWGLLAIGGVAFFILVKPIAPINSPLWDFTSRLNPEIVEMVGWQDLTKQVADIYRTIPENEKPRTVIVAANYGEAGALDLYGKQYDLPRIVSGANSLWYRGYTDFQPEAVIMVGFEGSYQGQVFKSCKYSGTVANSYGVKNEESTRHNGLYLCRGMMKTWSELWPGMQWFQ